MLRRLILCDVVIVRRLELEFGPGFTVLTGETGAGKSILVDALQLALGSRGDVAVVREGAARAEVSAEFDAPASLATWLDDGGFAAPDGLLLLRRTIDTQGRSRAWINGSAATVAQLREAAEHLVDIHGQHAWQGLTRPASVRALIDAQAGIDTQPLAQAWVRWRDARAALDAARAQRDTSERERERLTWQIGEVDKLAPKPGEWEAIDAEHRRLSHGQALLDGARRALDALSEGEPAADALIDRAIESLDEVARWDAAVAGVADVLRAALAQVQDAARTLHADLGRREPDPHRLAWLDERIAAWVSLARRYRRTPAELPDLVEGWRNELRALDAAADVDALEAAVAAAEHAWQQQARRVSSERRAAAPLLAAEVTAVMPQLGMGGGRFDVALLPLQDPQPYGLESAELRVAGHAGSTPRPLVRVASGGELSRLALAIAVTSARRGGGAGPPTLVFDEIDSGVGGVVADAVGALMKQLGAGVQVLAVTHLAQVAACADAHVVVSKALDGATTVADARPVAGEARVAEVARMLGGEQLSGTRHARALLERGAGIEAAR